MKLVIVVILMALSFQASAGQIFTINQDSLPPIEGYFLKGTASSHITLQPGGISSSQGWIRLDELVANDGSEIDLDDALWAEYEIAFMADSFGNNLPLSWFHIAMYKSQIDPIFHKATNEGEFASVEHNFDTLKLLDAYLVAPMEGYTNGVIGFGDWALE